MANENYKDWNVWYDEETGHWVLIDGAGVLRFSQGSFRNKDACCKKLLDLKRGSGEW